MWADWFRKVWAWGGMMEMVGFATDWRVSQCKLRIVQENQVVESYEPLVRK